MKTINFKDLPAVGAALNSGIFAGVITNAGKHVAVVLLYGRGERLNWERALMWAEQQDGELPTRPVAALLFANCKTKLTPGWHWTADEDDASYASYTWHCDFSYGYQSGTHKDDELAAVAVRYVEITA